MNSIKRSINNTQNRIRNITKSLSEKTSSKYNNNSRRGMDLSLLLPLPWAILGCAFRH